MDYLRNPSREKQTRYQCCDLHIREIVVRFFQEKNLGKSYDDIYGSHPLDKTQRLHIRFFEATWELCRCGILRPGQKTYYSSEKVEFEEIYTLTSSGKDLLKNSRDFDYIPTDPNRFAEKFSIFEPKFGQGFKSRTQEAIKCYNATAYLACCAMCGASAESILLSTAIAKKGDKDEVLKQYRNATGAKKVQDMIIDQKDQLYISSKRV